MEIVNSHIAGSTGSFEPQRKNNFMLRLASPRGVNLALIELSLKSFPFPGMTLEKGETPYWNEVRTWAQGPAKCENVELKLNDYVDQQTADAMCDWHRLVFDPETGKMGLVKDYKVQGDLILFAPDGSQERIWVVSGVWIKDQPKLGELSMEDGKQVEIGCTLVLDRVWKKR